MGLIKFLKGESGASANGHAKGEETPEQLSEEVTVYTTPYGTQYVMPTDILFTQEEKRQLLEEAEQHAAQLAQDNGNG